MMLAMARDSKKDARELNAEPVRRQGRARSVADVMPAVGGTGFKEFGFAQGALVARWPEIVGAAYARHSRPGALKFARGEKTAGTLEIAITGALAPMLAHVEPQIIERVNRVLGHGAVARVRLRHADIEPGPALSVAKGPVALSEETKSTLREIADPQLRATLEALAKAMAEKDGIPVIK
jgi:hypothetical protein